MSVIVQAFLVCKAITTRGRLNDLGAIYDVIAVRNFPYIHRDLAVFSQFAVAHEINCRAWITIETPSREDRRLLPPTDCMPSPNGGVTIAFRAPKVTFTEPGIYTLRLHVNKSVRSEFYLTAVARRKSQAG